MLASANMDSSGLWKRECKGACLMAVWAHAQALENIHRERMGRGSTASQYDEDIVPPVMKRAIAVYEAARVLMGFITPGYDEISQVP